ncbi:MAG: dinitrogenase iron-molybdenum cofactor biosynthesis protein [Candidatus Atribacteria bacterium]|jgi:predicted Fe-Mo cluster-binding NifX family protein|nr:dinitrogenase iron-molybdenum cofactor biosynthesis protein [Candidatus Atribacteria bacterium]
MKIAITSSGRDLQSDIDPRFGRCPNFIIYDTDNGQFEAVENTNIGGMGGVGVQSAQLMIDKGVKAVITGNCGPNAFSTLSAAGIKIITGASGKVEGVIEEYQKGNLKNADKPNSAPHSGLGPR